MKYITIALLILTSATAAMAQQQNTFIEFNAGYSIHDVNVKVKTGDRKLGGGLILYGGFGHYFSDHWGVTAGAKLITAKTTTELNFSDRVTQVADPQLLLDNEYKDLDIYYTNSKEKTTESVIYLPVGVAFRQMMGSKLSLEARLTAEPGFVMRQKYETVSGEINVVNSYINTFDGVDVKVENVSQLQEYGAGKAERFSGNADMKKFIFGMGASVGIVVPVLPRVALTANVYGSYSFTNQKNKNFPHVFDGERYVGLAQSELCSKIHPFTTGATVGVRVFVGREKQRIEPSEPIEIETPDPTQQQVVAQSDVVTDTITVDIRQIVDIASNEPAVKPAESSPVVVQQKLVDIEPITFDLGASQTAKDGDQIDQMAAIMKENPDMKFLIVGHTCNLGTVETNRIVGEKRAESLKNELIKRGVNPAQLSTESRWFKEPLVPNTSEANRKRNRRVEVIVIN